MAEEQLTEEQIANAVKAQLGDIKSGLLEEIEESLSGAESERFGAMEKSIEGIREELQKKFEVKPDEPGATDVKDLEKRLDEAEAKNAEVKEELRLIKAAPLIEKKDAEFDYGGSFLKVGQQERDYIRSYWLLPESGSASSMERKALDTGLFATGGKLPAEASDRFIDSIISQTVAISRVTTRRMNNPQGLTDELRVTVRSLRKATEGTAPPLTDAVTTKRRTIDTIETIWTEDITMTLLEDNIERAGLEGHIATIIATQYGTDQNDLAWNGDELSSDPFISINDGWLTLLQSSKDPDVNDADTVGLATNTDVLQKILQTMPSKFLGRTDHVFWVGVTFGQKYADEVATRETGLGDAVLIEGFPALRYFGIPVVPDTHIASASQRIILTPTSNLFWAIQRVFRVDSEFIPRKRLVEYTLTSRTDVEYATGEAVVNGINVPTSLN